MTNSTEAVAIPFRLNLEQQKKRAKELLRAYRSHDEHAVSRFNIHPKRSQIQFDSAKLADAQLVIARELGLASWAKLKLHIETMEQTKQLIDKGAPAQDRTLTTLHIRCGSDIKETLKLAGYSGDFLEFSDPVCQGPVRHSKQFIETRARFLSDHYGESVERSYDEILEGLNQEFDSLIKAKEQYDRVVLWFEHDTYDQLILARILAHFQQYGMPERLELVNINHFPGSVRFAGLGQLPPEAIHLLWQERVGVTSDQLNAGVTCWHALQSTNPQAIEALLDSSIIEPLPFMSTALKRHLQEFPSANNGLGLTEQLSLEVLSQQPMKVGAIFRELCVHREPMPWTGDIMFWDIFKRLADGDQAAIKIHDQETSVWHQCPTELTPFGQALLNNQADWMSSCRDTRYLGGVEIVPKSEGWRWDEKLEKLIFVSANES